MEFISIIFPNLQFFSNLQKFIFVYQINSMIQQTIQEVKFEDIILSKKQRQARKSNKLRHWLEYLNMLDENKDFNKKNQTIKEMHSMFILRQDFWLREVKRVLNHQTALSTQSFQFAFMALEDGFFIRVGCLIAQKLFEAYIGQKLRINFVLAKLQMMIAMFDFSISEGSYFFGILLKVYKKINNVPKIRETFLRQLSMGFDDYDVAYTEYMKWEQTQSKVLSETEAQQLLNKGKTSWQAARIFLQDQLPKIQISQDFIQSQQIKSSQKHIKRCLLYLEDMNTARIDEQKYVKLLNFLTHPKDRLWFLRRLALSETHELVPEYLEALQLSNVDDELVINTFKVSLNWQNGQKYQMPYLSYLLRRINKHLSKPQQQDYNSQWSQNVELFRNQISQLISKERSNLTDKKQIVTKYHYFWIEVETVVVKDIPTVQQLFDSLLNWEQQEKVYAQYAKYMIRLGDIPKARWIFNKTCETYHYQGTIVEEYQKFLSIYGSLQEIITLRQKIDPRPKIQTEKQPSTIIVCQVHHNEPKNTHKKHQKNQENGNGKEAEKKNQDEIKTVITKISQSLDNSPPEKSLEKQSKNQQQTMKRSAPFQSQKEPEAQPAKKKVHLDSQNTLFSSKINKSWTQADVMLNLEFKQNVSEIRIVDKQKGRFCYIEFDSEETAQKQLNQNKSALDLAFSHPPSKSDDRTLFLCNLPVEISKKEIKQLVPEKYQDEIKEIRSKQKYDKKTAYIEFSTTETRDEVLSILKSEKPKIDNRSIIVRSCQSDYSGKQKKNKTIYLKNLSFKCREKDIRSFFEQKGFHQIEEIFIPKDQKTNRPKGYAYVEFQNHQEFQKVAELQKGELFGRQFYITRSDRCITQHESSQGSNRSERDHSKRPQNESSQGSSRSQREREQSRKPKEENKKSNNFFSNIFS